MWQLIGFIAASLTMFGFIPQIIEMRKKNSVENISLLTLVQFSAGVFLWIIYGVHLRDVVIISANIVSFATLIAAILVYLKIKHYKKNI
ncbi:MAG: SemiSWEET family transporter [bacterium]|nr:SemiSWEET family transporter [bacterium]